MNRAAVVGAGIGGLAAAALLAKAGRQVTVFDQAAHAGGKAASRELGGFRFDTGPSLFTLPQVFRGFFARLGPLTIQLQPELHYAENKPYSGYLDFNNANTWDAYYATYNYIDLPEKFGDLPFQSLSWGQSSIRLNAGPVSFGISNENLWWGPGYRNSLLMTNSAPGFKHFTLNTTSPIRTYIGNFEFQVVAGKLDSSGFPPPLPSKQSQIQPYYLPKPHDWRYFNGMILMRRHRSYGTSGSQAKPVQNTAPVPSAIFGSVLLRKILPAQVPYETSA